MKLISLITLVLTSITISLLVLEIIIRLSSFTPSENKFKDWTFVTSSKQQFFMLDKDRIYKIMPDQVIGGSKDWASDKDGFRYNPLHAGKQRKENMKIVVVGDSFTYGHGVGHNETFPFLLEKKLNAQGHSVRIDNAGVPGYGLDQEFVYLKEDIIPKYRPDIVIWAVNYNDFDDSNHACLFIKVDKKYLQLSGRLNSLYFKKDYFEKLPRFIRQSYLFLLIDSKIPERYTLGCSRIETNESEIAEKAEYFFRELKVMSRKENFNLYTIIVLNQHYFENNPGLEGWENELTRIDKLSELYIMAAKKSGIPILNTNTRYAFESESKSKVLGGSTSIDIGRNELFLEEKYFVVGWRHPNKVGNELTSEQVADVIENLYLK